MKKNFTFILLSLLLFVVGGAKSQTNLNITGGKNWEASEYKAEASPKWYSTDEGLVHGIVYFKESRSPRYCRVGGKAWATTFSAGATHTFTVTLNNSFVNQYDQTVSNLASGFTLVAVKGGVYSNNELTDDGNNWSDNSFKTDGDGSSSLKVVASTGPESTFTNNQLVLELAVEEDYDAVYLYAQDCNYKFIKIESIVRTEGAPVAAPTISPASGTYDGELSVTIAKGEDNTKVVYSVSGSAAGDVKDKEFTSDNLVLNLTGTSTITVTATGYDSENNPSSTVTNTYTFGIPDGKETATVTYYQIVPLTMSDGTTPAYFDFEDGTTLITGTSNINSDKLSIVDCDTSHETSTGGSKCMKVDLTDKSSADNFYDVQVQLIFNSALEQNKQYQVHYWTKADTYVNNQTYVRFQANGNNGWTEYNKKEIAYGTDWTEYSYAISVNGNYCTMMVFDLGKVAANTIYLDDVVVYDVTDGNTPVEFTSKLKTAVVSASAFNDFAEGDYICLNITGTPTEIGYKTHATNDEKAISNYPSYSALSKTNGNWLIPVTSDIKSNGLSIKGYSMTLSSVDLFKKVVLDQDEDNTVTKYDNVAVYLDRSFVADTWNTVCLPFVPTTAQADELFGSGYTIAEFTGVTGTTLEFSSFEIEDFEAGQPYLVKPTADLSTPVVLFDVDITAKNGATVTHEGYSFTGTFTTKSFASGDWATTRFVATNNKLNTPNSTNAMKALRCYFTVPAESSARGYAIDGFMDDDVPTDISATLNDNVQTTKVIYNLAGQRVANPTKGLYIVNGQKVVVK